MKFCGDCGAELDVARARRGAARRRRAMPPRPSGASCPCSSPTWSASRRSPRGATPEEVRELLSRYFELARTLIARYGGTVEKFIGDAVMAVWGTPTATEDDAERAVRAALDLVAAVPGTRSELCRPEPAVLTGEAAVTIGAEGQGMVAGDLVNTASRVQSAAEPGTVLVGESTKRATEQAVAYEEAGRARAQGQGRGGHALPRSAGRLRAGGRAQGGRPRGALRRPRARAEADQGSVPRLGGRDGRAQLVSVTGIAGIGKSRLTWEFYKYFDGIVDTVWWHRGRCLAYGEGVAYWALADMVRMRCLIGEEEPPRLGAAEAVCDAARAPARSGGARVRRAAPRAPARARGSFGLASDRTCSRPGACSSSASPTRIRVCSPSRTCSGRTRACSTSSSTCSSGRATTRCS